MIGKNSYVVKIKINDHEFLVQGNKNYGICDIQPKVNEVLTDFQGQQLNNPEVVENLEHALFHHIYES